MTADSTGSGSIVVKATVNGTDYTCTVTIGVSYNLSFGTVTGAGSGSTFISSQTATIPVTLLQNGVAYTTSTQVTWSIVSVDNSNNPAVRVATATGLAWGASPVAPVSAGTALTSSTTSNTDTFGDATIELTDIMGERTVSVQAKVTIGGVDYTATQAVTFGKGPLSVFRHADAGAKWANHRPISNPENSEKSDFPAAYMCGTSLTAAELRALSDGYHTSTMLPSKEQLQAVSDTGTGAWRAAGWYSAYWTGEVSADGPYAVIVDRDGSASASFVDYEVTVVCLRP